MPLWAIIAIVVVACGLFVSLFVFLFWLYRTRNTSSESHVRLVEGGGPEQSSGQYVPPAKV